MALGQEQNTYQVNEPGLYKDPASKAELTVTMHAGADALVRLGWQRIGEVEEDQIKNPYEVVATDPEVEEVKTNTTKVKETTNAKV